MYFGFTIPELIVLVFLIILSIATLVAALNKNWINRRIERIFEWFENGFEDTGGWLKKILFAAYLYPGRFTSNIQHDGWRNGLTASSLVISSFLFAALLGIVLFIAFWLIIITIALWLIGTILGGGTKRY